MAGELHSHHEASDDELTEEERRRFIKMLREGWEDLAAGRIVAAEVVEQRAEDAIARGAARWKQQRPSS